MTPELEQKLRDGIRAAEVERDAGNRERMKAVLEANGVGILDALGVGPFPRDVIAKMVEDGDIASPKQAWATLEKWSRRGEYDYGVSLDLGWLEETK